ESKCICPGEFLKTRPTMAHRRLQSSRLALLVGRFSAFLLAPAPRVSAEPIDPQANSLQSAVDSFVAYLKTETNAVMPRRLKQGGGSAEPSLERGCRLVLGQDRAISTRRARRDRCLAAHSIAAGR